MESHPFANLFPMLSDEELQRLADDIKANGQEHPVILYKGLILDGRNRFKACVIAGVEPQFSTFEGTEAAAFKKVISLNVERRHLTASQRSMVAAEAANMSHGGDRSKGQNCTLNVTIEDAAEALSVSPRLVKSARKVWERGSQELASAVVAGDISVTAAAEIATLPKQEQAAVVEAMQDSESVVRDAVSRARQPRSPVESASPHVSFNSGNNEWYTPQEYITAAVAVMGGIDVDPASSKAANKVVGAKKFYTAADNGLSKEWRGRVWMNPPYASELVGQFCSKLVAHVEAKDVTEAIVLVNNATETSWFSDLASVASAVVFPRGRVKFWEPGGTPSAPLQGQAVIYIGKSADKFLASFSQFGWGATL